MISKDDPLIFIILSLAIFLVFVIILFCRNLRKKGKNISFFFTLFLVIFPMCITGAILGLITSSGPTLIVLDTIGMGILGVIMYVTMELLERLREKR
jgi:hypothetical protein